MNTTFTSKIDFVGRAGRLISSVVRPAAVVAIGAALMAGGVVHAAGWEFAPSMPAPKADTFAVKYGGAIYMIGGMPWANGDQDGSVYKLSNGVWSTAAPLIGLGPVVGQGGGVDSLNHIIVFGGMTTPDGDIAEGRAYNPVSGTSFTVPNVNISLPPINFGLAVDGQGRIYRLGGGPGMSGFNYGGCTRYLAASNSWEDVAYLPYTRASIASAYDGLGHIWGFGGYTSFGFFRILDTIRYTVATNTWENMGSLYFPVPTSNGKAVLGADGRLYIIGGFAGSTGYTPSSTVYIIDPSATDPVLLTGPSLNVPRSDFGAVLGDDGYIYVIGGYAAGGVALASVERLYTGVTVVPGDVNGDGHVNIDDLLAVINSWGACPVPPATCAADVNDSGAVNIDDLLMVINGWG